MQLQQQKFTFPLHRNTTHTCESYVVSIWIYVLGSTRDYTEDLFTRRIFRLVKILILSD